MTNIANMPEEVRKFVRKLIKVHCKKNKIYSQANKHGIGLEETEETIERLLDTNELIIETDDDDVNPSFRIIPGQYDV